MSYLFAFSYCSWGSQGKNTEAVCHSLLQWTTFCQTSPPWPVCLRWPHAAWLSFIELDKLCSVWSDWLVVCDCFFSLSALWCPFSVPTFLLGFLLPSTWGISSWLLQQSAAASPYLGRGVVSQPLPRPLTLGSSSWGSSILHLQNGGFINSTCLMGLSFGFLKPFGASLGGLVIRSPRFHCRGYRFDPWWGTKILRDTQQKEKKKKDFKAGPLNGPHFPHE